MVTLLKEMCSSKEATFLTLNKMLQKCAQSEEKEYIEAIMEKLMNLEINAKAEKVIEIIEKHKIKSLFY
jgi:Superfamily II DNA/RNA helicases, SNF2 family